MNKQALQMKFVVEVKNLTEVIHSYGNPFLEESKELLLLGSRNIVDSGRSRLVSEVETIGQKQYDDFVEKGVINGRDAFFAPIKKNKFKLFGSYLERDGKDTKFD